MLRNIFAWPRERLIPLACALGLWSCGQNVWPDRQSAVVDDIRVDSLGFAPAGTRFLAQSAAARILFHKFYKGFAGSSVLKLELDTAVSGYFPPLTRVRLPTDARSAMDVAGSDSEITFTFPAGANRWIKLANSNLTLTDSAWLFKGVMHYDSLSGVPDSARAMAGGRWLYRDSSAAGKVLRAASLGPCEALNQSEFSRHGDTVKVRLSWVTMDPDPSAGADSCGAGPSSRDSVPVWPATL